MKKGGPECEQVQCWVKNIVRIVLCTIVKGGDNQGRNKQKRCGQKEAADRCQGSKAKLRRRVQGKVARRGGGKVHSTNTTDREENTKPREDKSSLPCTLGRSKGRAGQNGMRGLPSSPGLT